MDAALSECIRRLSGRKEPAPLVPGKIWDPELDATIGRLLPDREPLKGALHLWNDNLSRAHEIVQEIETPTAGYLHGVMHRREPDYGNSKYWFRRVGDHPLFQAVREAALDLLAGRFAELKEIRAEVEKSGSWDALRMVDWCQEAEGKDDPLARFLRSLQSREIGLLVDACGRPPRG
jgi:hypothetical protein